MNIAKYFVALFKVKVNFIFIIPQEMNYQLCADILWYVGHTLTGFAIVANHYNFYLGIIIVFIGQFITIISRPIGRMKN